MRGLFRDTLPALRDRQWSVIRADCDMYESTHDVLVNLYSGLASGGYVVADEYYHMVECRTAVEDYRRQHGIIEPIIRIDRQAAYWPSQADNRTPGNAPARQQVVWLAWLNDHLQQPLLESQP